MTVDAATFAGAAAFAAALALLIGLNKRAEEAHWLKVRQRSFESESQEKLSALQLKAAQAGLEIPASHLALIGIAGAAAGAVVVAAITGKAMLSIVGLAVGLWAPSIWVNRKVKGRALLFEAQFETSLGHMAASMRAGQTVHQALEQAALGSPPPTRDVLGQAVLFLRSGHSVTEALEEAAKMVNSRDLKVAAAAVGLHAQTGGDLALNLDQIADSIRDRRAFRSQVGAAVSEGALTSNLLAVLPFGVVGGMRAMSPEYMAPLFNTTQGMLVLALCSVFIVLGWLVIRKIITIEY